MASNKTISIKFPFEDDDVNGRLYKMNTTTLDDVRSSLYFFLTTKKGERWYDPNFGSRLHEFIFEKNDPITATDIENSIREDIQKYFKNLEIKTIDIDQSEETNRLSINISFSYTNLYSVVSDNISLVYGA
jgi:phage baseplate assembly protein W